MIISELWILYTLYRYFTTFPENQHVFYVVFMLQKGGIYMFFTIVLYSAYIIAKKTL